MRSPSHIVLLAALASLGPLRAAPVPNPMPPGSIVTRTLANGATVIVRRISVAPVAVVDLWVRAGAADDGGTGAAHALEHMLFKGSREAPAERADAAVETTGGVVSASTLPDATHFWTTAPPNQVTKIIATLPRIVREPALDPVAWERERNVILEEIDRAQTDLPAQVRRALSQKLFGSPGAPASGTVDSIRALTPDALRAFYARWYRPDHIVMVVTGQVDVDAALKAADAALASFPRQTPLPVAVAAKPVSDQADVTLVSGGQCSVGLGFAVADGVGPALDVACSILRTRLRRALSSVTDSVDVARPWQRLGMVAIVASGPEADGASILSSVRRVVNDFAGSITDAEVASAVRAKQWSWWLGNETPVSQALALGLAATLGDLTEATLAPEHLRMLTTDEVRQAALQAFRLPQPVASGRFPAVRHQ